ncbi:MAG: restriction endonuclease subunit S [Sporichthyaceae bacterium]
MRPIPLRVIAQVMVSNVDKKSVEGERPVRLCNYTDVYYNAQITGDLPFMEATATIEQIAKFSLRKGDVIITKDSETPDDIGVPAYVAQDIPGLVCGYHLAVVRPRSERVDGSYLGWLMRSDLIRNQLGARATGVTRYGLTYEAIQGVSALVPPMTEQRRIADFLDDQVGRMDGSVAVRKGQLELFSMRVASRIGGYIAAALEGGKGAPIRPLRQLLEKQSKRPLGGETMVTAFRDGQVIARDRRRSEGFTDAWTDGAAVQGVNVGDVVIHGLDGFAGAVGTSESDGVCSPANHVCVPTDGGDSDFYGRMLRILALSGYLSQYGGSARERAVDFRNWEKFSSTPIPVVDVVEQKEIGSAIRSARPLQDGIAGWATLMGERKRALITACLTREFDVSTAGNRAADAALQGVAG